jgi:hypothetical protein
MIGCDCGCNAQTEISRAGGWLTLSQQKYLPDNNNELKLDDDFYFASLPCLVRWTRKAQAIAIELKKQAEKGPATRGWLVSDSLPGAHV